MSQTSIIPNYASAGIPALSANSRNDTQGASLEQQFLAMIEESLTKLGLTSDQVEVRVQNASQSTPQNTAKNTAPKTAASEPHLVVSISQPTTAAAAAQQPTGFLATFQPKFEAVTSTVTDVGGHPIGSVPLSSHHYASLATAEMLAQQLGAKVVEDSSAGLGVPERHLQFSEGGELLNAGLVAHAFELARERGESMESVVVRLQAELTHRLA